MLLNQILWTLNIIQIIKFVYCTEDDYKNNYNNQDKIAANDVEIKTLTGEPNYKSVNLTWAIDSVDTKDTSSTTIGSSSGDVKITTTQPTSAHSTRGFTVFYCEIQSTGPQRCKSKILEDNEIDVKDRHNKQYSMVIDNLRMATKYSFHVKSQNKKRGTQKISGRADLGINELGPNGIFQGQSIIVPTKGFSAHATQCLPHASEIEVETGPYFGGRIVAEGGGIDCGIRGKINSKQESYTMRIDHERCGSKVNHETLTVETFITVQENLDIFTHSTRRFVVVCTYQPDTLTVRASFSVPGRNGIAADISTNLNENVGGERRNGRERKFKMVGKNALVLKENYSDNIEQQTDINGDDGGGGDDDDDNDKIVPTKMFDKMNENDLLENKNSNNNIKLSMSENVVNDFNNGPTADDSESMLYFRNPKYLKLMDEQNNLLINNYKSKHIGDNNSNYTGVVIAISLSVIMVGALIFIIQRENKKQRISKS